MSTLLEIEGLSVTLPAGGEQRQVIHDVSLAIGEGEAHGLVGESGSGKSMTARSIMRLLPPGAEVQGAVRFDGTDVNSLDRGALRRFRGNDVAMIFQDPRSHTNPVRTIGDFMTEALCRNRGMGKRDALKRAAELLEEVFVDDPERRLTQYPDELSGGLLQRVMISAALAVEPRLIIADEPTTALDVTNQAEVMAILDELRRERGLAMLFITHDLDLAAAVCDHTSVMYAGFVVESQASERLHDRPRHPYSAALSHARPSIDRTLDRLPAVPGRPLSAFEAPSGCAFADRCPFKQTRCVEEAPALRELDGAMVRCHRAEELAETLAGSFQEDLSGHT
ncbi:MAG: peptide/nickel transport system ATP-binding protein [Thermoleophilaceae bacterium]|jgi:oligopeptide/dipeptide ABC transporter ATP-binding protein|nr:peptide/nickel transport system ATP-binding protein [Thermoleophilaceae bacterium]